MSNMQGCLEMPFWASLAVIFSFIISQKGVFSSRLCCGGSSSQDVTMSPTNCGVDPGQVDVTLAGCSFPPLVSV